MLAVQIRKITFKLAIMLINFVFTTKISITNVVLFFGSFHLVFVALEHTEKLAPSNAAELHDQTLITIMENYIFIKGHCRSVW